MRRFGARKHCGKFNASNIWFLDDTNECTNRRLLLGTCPQCYREIGELVETNKKTNLVLSTTYQSRALSRLKEQEKRNIQYTSQDVNSKKKLLGGCMG
jgi:hypothetical protein